MFIKFEDDNDKKYGMVEAWNDLVDLGQNPYIMNHHELAKYTSDYMYTSEDWKEFLTHPLVIQELELELSILRRNKIHELTESLDSKTKSTGQAQLLTSMMKAQADNLDSKDSGPIFIYSFVPLNNEEKNAPNVRILEKNPFIRND